MFIFRWQFVDSVHFLVVSLQPYLVSITKDVLASIDGSVSHANLVHRNLALVLHKVLLCVVKPHIDPHTHWGTFTTLHEKKKSGWQAYPCCYVDFQILAHFESICYLEDELVTNKSRFVLNYKFKALIEFDYYLKFPSCSLHHFYNFCLTSLHAENEHLVLDWLVFIYNAK